MTEPEEKSVPAATLPLSLSIGFVFLALSFMLRTGLPDAVRFGIGLPVFVVAFALAISTIRSRRAARRAHTA